MKLIVMYFLTISNHDDSSGLSTLAKLVQFFNKHEEKDKTWRIISQYKQKIQFQQRFLLIWCF